MVMMGINAGESGYVVMIHCFPTQFLCLTRDKLL